jgi:hypothetical protein
MYLADSECKDTTQWGMFTQESNVILLPQICRRKYILENMLCIHWTSFLIEVTSLYSASPLFFFVSLCSSFLLCFVMFRASSSSLSLH